MGDNFIVNRGLESKIKLQQHQPGAIWLTEDGQNIYLDSKIMNKRIHITDVIDITNESDEIKSLRKYYPNKVYIDGHSLKKYNANTGNLEIISNLESEVLESKNEFNYHADDSSKATIFDNSQALKGTIVIDKNGDVGIVTSSTTTTLSISILANNKSKNILSGYDIYFDSNYVGYQVGTFEQPFNSVNQLYEKCKDKLASIALTTIHLKSNSTFTGDSSIECELKNTIFVSDKSATIDGNIFTNQTFTDVTFYNVNINLLDITNSNTNNVLFDNCIFSGKLTLKGDKVFIKNSVIRDSEVAINEACNITIENTVINGGLSSHACENCDIYLINSNINDIYFTESSATIYVYNTIINNIVDITSTNVFFYSGKLMGENFNINSSNYCLGTFDFSNAIANIEGEEQTPTGLSSEQIYDKSNNRSYGIPVNNTLKAHLDKIGESIKNLNDALLETNSLTNSFKTKDVFESQDDLIGEFRIGDVMTYVNESSTNLQFAHNLSGDNYESKLEYDYTNINYIGSVEKYDLLPPDANTGEVYEVLFKDDDTPNNAYYRFDGLEWTIVDKEKFLYYYFSLENASYFAKFNDKVSLFNYSEAEFDIDNVNITEDVFIQVPIYLVNENEILVKIKQEDLIEIISKDISILTNNRFDENDNKTLANQLIENHLLCVQNNSIFNQIIKISHKDRLIRLSNGWDKLSGSSDGIGGNYHIVSTYGRLSGIDNNETRTIGTLAYVQDEDQMYQWKYKDGSDTEKIWTTASLGGGTGGSRAILEMDVTANLEKHRPNNDAFQLPVILKKCTTGTLKCIYYFTNKIERFTKTIDISGPDTYTFDIDSIPNNEGALRISVSFISTDENILSPESNLNYTFYIGNVLKINSASFEYNLPDNVNYSKKTYILNQNQTVTGLTTNSYYLKHTDFLNGLKITYNVNNADALTPYKLKYEIINKLETKEDKRVLYSANGINESIHNNGNIEFPLVKQIDGREQNYLNVGYYEIKIQAYNDDMDSDVYTLPFIVDSCNTPYSFILNYEQETLSTEDNIISKLVILFNNNSVNNTFKIESYVNDTDNNNKCINETIELNLKNDNNIDVHDIMMSINNADINVTHKCYFQVKLLTESNHIKSINEKQIIFNESEYLQIINANDSNIMFALDSRQKSNLSNTKDIWQSPYTKYFENASAVVLNNFTFSNNGWVINADENGKDVVTLTFDGDGTHATINMSPLLLNENSPYNVKKGYTFEIKFKSTELYKNGTVLECLDERNRGMKITDNEVIFSPYSDINVVNNENQLRSRLTRNEWHTITFVLLPKNEYTYGNFYHQYFYGKEMNGESSAMLFIDGIISGLVTDTQSSGYYTTNISYNKIYLGASYDNLKNVYTNYSKVQIMHITCYNKALSPNDILNNFIAYNHDMNAQNKLKVLNGYELDDNNVGSFGNANDELIPVLTISNAYLKALDAQGKDTAKDFLFPNVGIKLTYKGITLIDKYGCELKAQGTSSLSYPIKNYKITHYDFDTPQDLADIIRDAESGLEAGTYGTMYNKSANEYKCKKEYRDADGNWQKYKKYAISVNGWLPEHTFTLKADFMESSHSRNAGTAMFINTYMNKVPPMQPGSEYDRPNSQLVSKTLDDITNGDITTQDQYNAGTLINPLDRLQNAIAGFPCILQYTYTDENGIQTVNHGIYMFDVDKNAEYVFGYDRYETECKSYEISNNNIGEDASGAAAFDLDIISDKHESYRSLKNDIEIRYHGSGDDAINEIDETLKLGYEYDSSDESDEVLRGQKTDADILPDNVNDYHSELKHLYMWMQDCVSKNDDGTISYNYTKFKDEIEEHFDLENLLRYIILTKVLGMTDNLAKNMMITTWDCGSEYITFTNDGTIDYSSNNKFAKWYLQFYDLDTQLGLTNDGHNRYSTSLEIKGHEDKYDVNGNLISTKGLHINNDNTLITIEDNKSAYEKAYNVSDVSYDKYNGFNSLLWRLILGAYDSIIVAIGNKNKLQLKYAELRDNMLQLDNLKKFYFDKISNNIGQYYYNNDALNKYFGHNYLEMTNCNYMCLGSAKNHISDWLENRLMYWDSKYMYNSANWTFRPYPNGTINTFFSINTLAPVYVGLLMSDTNQDGTQLMCTSEDTNIFSSQAGYDWASTMYNVDFITKMSIPNSLQLTELKLNNFNKLTSLDISTLLSVKNIEINSPVLQYLYINNSKTIPSINVSKLNELVELDISNSNISSLVLEQGNFSNTSIKRLNIENSKLDTLDLSTLKNLESLNKYDMTIYNFDMFINKLNAWRLISQTAVENLTNDDKLYIDRLANQFKNYLISTQNMSFNDTLSSYELLRMILDNENYRKKLGKQYIPNLAIITVMNNYDSATQYQAFKNVKLNSNNIRAIEFDINNNENKSNLYYGYLDGIIDIKGDNIKYVSINKIGITTGNIHLSLPSLEYLNLNNNSSYSGEIDLSKSENLQFLKITSFYYLLGVKISKTLRNLQSLTTINFNYNFRMKYFIDDSQTYDTVLDFDGFDSLTELNIGDVCGFTKICNLHIHNYDNYKHILNCSQARTGFMPPRANIENCSLEPSDSSTTVSLYKLFYYRTNLVFGFGTNDGLNIDNLLKKCNNLNYAFYQCQQLSYTELLYILNKWTYIHSKQCYYAFAYCFNIGNGIHNVNRGTNKGEITQEMFPDTMNSVTDASYMYFDITKTDVDIVSGTLDALTSVTNISGLFSKNTYSLYKYNIYNDEDNIDITEIVPKNLYVYSSYIKSMPYDLFSKCTELVNIGQSDNAIYTPWAGSGDDELKIIDGDFNKILDNMTTALSNYNFIFACSKRLIQNNSTITLNGDILNNAGKKLSGNYSLKGAFSNCSCNINLDNMFGKLNTSVIYDMCNMFSSFKGNINNFKSSIFLKNNDTLNDDIIKASDMSFMFANNSNMSGLLLPYKSDESTEYTDESTGEKLYNYKLYNGFNDDFSILYKQDKVENIAGMFYNCSSLGGLKIITDDNIASTIRKFSNIKDIPNTFFTDAKRLQNAAHLFNGCSKLNLWFDDLDKNNSRVYLFNNNEQLKNIAYMFANSSLKHSLPTYGNKGSSLNDCEYFYYDITEQVNKWLNDQPLSSLGYPDSISFVNVNYDFTKFEINEYFDNDSNKIDELKNQFNEYSKTLDTEYDNDVDSPSTFIWTYISTNVIDVTQTWNDESEIAIKFNEEYGSFSSDIDDYRKVLTSLLYNGFDNITKRVYNLSNIHMNSAYSSEFDKTYTYENTVDNTINIYQYYKECKVDENSKYLHNEQKNHEEFLENNGFLYIDTSNNPLKIISGLFSNTKINGGVPSNIFRNLINITDLNYVFNDCSYLGLTDSDVQNSIADIKNVSGYRNINSSTEMDVNTRYTIPYGLLDTCENVKSLNYLFKNVYYLSRPYKTWGELTGSNEYAGSDRNDALYFGQTTMIDEIYIIPKYLLYYLPSLQECIGTFKGESATNNLFGHLYNHMFKKNGEIVNISYMFYNTHVYGCETIPEEYIDDSYSSRVGTKYYIGETLLSYLKKLSNVEYLFDKCTDLLNIILIETTNDYNNAFNRDLLFTSAVHGKSSYLQTRNVIYLNEYYPDASAYRRTHNNDVKMRLVHMTNTTKFELDKQCYEVFVDSYKNGTSLRQYQ